MLLQLLLFAVIAVAAGKKFTAYEVKEQLTKHGVPDDQIPKWLCIVERNTRKMKLNSNYFHWDYYGLLQFVRIYAFSEQYCNIDNEEKCKEMMTDDDIQDDIKCALAWYKVWNIPKKQSGFKGFDEYEKCKKVVKWLENASSRVFLNVAALLLCALGLITFN